VPGQRKALIIANDEYEQEGLRNLLAPAADAEALGRVLGDPLIGEFDVRVARNELSHVIQAQIEELFSESLPDDLLLLHFSGHGLKSEAGELFFAAPNTRPDRLGSTAVAADFVQKCMRNSRSRSIVLLLDCCYGGAFSQGVAVRAAGTVHVMDSFPKERPGGGRGRAVISASSAMEYAFEGNHLADNQHPRPSLFTAALVEGLATGEADRDEDGWVSLDELYDYVFDKVREQNPHQTPTRQVEMQGELYLARSPRQRIRISAASVPADLRAAMTDPNVYTRLGAVSELRARLFTENLSVAEGAREALAELARTDVRFVVDPATAALAEVALQPSPTELHFGSVEQGSAPPHRLVRLLGPPIARECVPYSSHSWILVNRNVDGLDISVETFGTGALQGTAHLRGPTGVAIVAITVNLTPPSPQVTPTRRPVPSNDQGRAGSAYSPTGPCAERTLSRPSMKRLSPPSGPRLAPQYDEQDSGHTSGQADRATDLAAAPAVPATRDGHVLWALIPVLSLGLLLPAPFAYAAARLRSPKLWIVTLAYATPWVVLLPVIIAQSSLGHVKADLYASGWLLFFAVVGAVHAFRLRRRVLVTPSVVAPQTTETKATAAEAETSTLAIPKVPRSTIWVVSRPRRQYRFCLISCIALFIAAWIGINKAYPFSGLSYAMGWLIGLSLTGVALSLGLLIYARHVNHD
jgi:hypothetical protein